MKIEDCGYSLEQNGRPPLSDSLITVVLPVYNEAAVLETLHEQVQEAIVDCGTNAEIVFVNDGSTDASARILDCLADQHHNIRVVHFSRNFGHQAAVQAGLEQARGDAVVLMDADLQDAPQAIGQFLEQWQAGYDVVYAIRVDRKESIYKRALFAGFHKLLASVATTPIPADAGNFGLLDARVVKEIVALGEKDRYLPGLRSWVGFRQTGVPVERNARYDDCPRVSLRGLWRLAKTAIFSFSTLPLSIFYIIGYIALAVFLALSGFAVYCRLFTDLAIPGWTSFMIVGSFFGAINALGISMLGEYVIRIYDQVRARPLYLVDRMVEHSRVPVDASAMHEHEDWDDHYQNLLDESSELLDMARGRTTERQEAYSLGKEDDSVELSGRSSRYNRTEDDCDELPRVVQFVLPGMQDPQ
ncbi:MAG: glycosyltransferase family 2 protein [Planctomycetota bacterium]|nr:glycosyltransferase family 2 protein [Planctomycetota bacterium]